MSHYLVYFCLDVDSATGGVSMVLTRLVHRTSRLLPASGCPQRRVVAAVGDPLVPLDFLAYR